MDTFEDLCRAEIAGGSTAYQVALSADDGIVRVGTFAPDGSRRIFRVVGNALVRDPEAEQQWEREEAESVAFYKRYKGRDEFEADYARSSGLKIEQVHALGRLAYPCRCADPTCCGWQMLSPESAESEVALGRLSRDIVTLVQSLNGAFEKGS